ncbi:MAG: chromosomal replication initiator protein DnaA [Eubacterium sp.]|nr:chromosomal replication initiator protein DnaA [Eubacterium sp.]
METAIKDNWTQIIEFLRDNYDVLNILYRTWILPLEVISESDSEVTIAIDESKQGDITGLIDKKYRIPLQTSIEAITGKTVSITFVSRNSQNEEKGVSSYYNSEDQKTKTLEEKYIFLRSGHSFDNFVVSSSNRLAHAAAVAVAENPNGQIYNPLFLYSGPGLGKTHLMHSISRYILENHPEYKLLYTTSEKFTNDVVESIMDNKQNKSALPNLRDKYRNVDVLLIDDIQFIIEKKSTLQEFFHTFEELFQNGKQLVISSDKPPSEMEGLEERYKTRFSSGLPVDIQPPDYETAMAILKLKQTNEDIQLSEDILSYIASNARSSIRDLEGAYTKVKLLSKLSGPDREITQEMVENALKDIINENSTVNLTAEYIIDVVCSHFNVDKDRLLSERRTKEISYPRQICMYLCSEYTSLTQQVIAEKLKRKNHTTVNHAVKTIKDDLLVDNELQNTINVLKKKLNVN